MNRRAVLARGAVVGTVAIAGCSGVLDDSSSGNDSTDGSSDATTTDDGGSIDAEDSNGSDDASGSYDPVARWTVAAEGSSPAPAGYEVFQRSASRMLALSDDVSGSLAERMRRRIQYVWGSPDPSSLDHEITITTPEGSDVPSYTVYVGSFDDGAARTQLEDAGGATAGSHEGYDLYTDVSRQSSTVRAYAVGDGTVVEVGAARGATATADHLRRIVDTSVGANEPVVARDQPLQRAADRIEPGVVSTLERVDPTSETSLESGSFTGISAAGGTASLDGPILTQNLVVHFESADAASKVSVDSYVDATLSTDRIQSAEATVDGRFLRSTSTTDAAAELGL